MSDKKDKKTFPEEMVWIDPKSITTIKDKKVDSSEKNCKFLTADVAPLTLEKWFKKGLIGEKMVSSEKVVDLAAQKVKVLTEAHKKALLEKDGEISILNTKLESLGDAAKLKKDFDGLTVENGTLKAEKEDLLKEVEALKSANNPILDALVEKLKGCSDLKAFKAVVTELPSDES